jgi:hypothetical protein
MLGAEGVLDGVLAFLEAGMPAKCTELEVRLGLDAGAVPPPLQYSPTDLPDVDQPKYPLVIAEAVDQPDMSLVDHETGDSLGFVVNYSIRVHVLSRTMKKDDVAGAELGRNRLLLAITELVLLHPALDSNAIRLARRRVTAKYAPYMRDTHDRVISPGYLDLPISAEEQLAGIPLAEPPITTTVITTTVT